MRNTERHFVIADDRKTRKISNAFQGVMILGDPVKQRRTTSIENLFCGKKDAMKPIFKTLTNVVNFPSFFLKMPVNYIWTHFVLVIRPQMHLLTQSKNGFILAHSHISGVLSRYS